MSFTECLICGTKNNDLEDLNGIFLNKCNECGFQYIPNNNQYLEKNYYSNYSRREDSTTDKRNELRREQYRIDAKICPNTYLKIQEY